jgi:dUTP pyrophosphatase
MQVKIKRLSPDVPMPQYQTPGSAAFDLAAAEDKTIPAHGIALVATGLVVCTPEGFMLMLASRSSLPLKKGLTLANGVGIVDQDYCGPQDEVKVQILNLTDNPVEIKTGDRIAQAMFVKIDRATLEETESLDKSDSRGGFGGTGGYGQ